MNEAMIRLLRSDRRDLLNVYETVAAAKGSHARSIEKDLWVCWTLDYLFNRRPDKGDVHMIFKGGTSLSKCYGVIDRFSEDIDLTLAKADIGAPSDKDVYALPSSSRRRKAIDNDIVPRSIEYVSGRMKADLEEAVAELGRRARLPRDLLRVETGSETVVRDGVVTTRPEPQTLLLHYPTLSPDGPGYIRNVVKIEMGARANPNPALVGEVVPYLADAVRGLRLDMRVKGVTATAPQRTFWEKVHIVHGLRSKHDRRVALDRPDRAPPCLDRFSRHYYDIHRILTDVRYGDAAQDRALARDCVLQKTTFFPSPDEGMENARPGGYALVPSAAMLDELAVDYREMRPMIFGQAPSFEEVLGSVATLETRLNRSPETDEDPAVAPGM